MPNPYGVGGDYKPVKTRGEVVKEKVAAFFDRQLDNIVASIKSIPGEVKTLLKHKWEQGADEFANGLIRGDSYMPWPGPSRTAEAPTIESPIQGESQVGAVRTEQSQEKAFSHDYTPSQSLPTRTDGLSAYMSGKYEQPVYTPTSEAEIVNSYLSGNYVGNGDPMKAEMNAVSAEMREDYAARAEINAMRVEPIQPPEWEGMSR